MPSHWTGETDSPEVELSKRDRSNAPTLYCLFGGGRKRLWDHSTFIAFQSYSDLARLEYETKVILKYARSFFPTYPNRTFDYLVERKADSLGGISRGKKENTYLLLLRIWFKSEGSVIEAAREPVDRVKASVGGDRSFITTRKSRNYGSWPGQSTNWNSTTLEEKVSLHSREGLKRCCSRVEAWF